MDVPAEEFQYEFMCNNKIMLRNEETKQNAFQLEAIDTCVGASSAGADTNGKGKCH